MSTGQTQKEINSIPRGILFAAPSVGREFTFLALPISTEKCCACARVLCLLCRGRGRSISHLPFCTFGFATGPFRLFCLPPTVVIKEAGGISQLSDLRSYPAYTKDRHGWPLHRPTRLPLMGAVRLCVRGRGKKKGFSGSSIPRLALRGPTPNPPSRVPIGRGDSLLPCGPGRSTTDSFPIAKGSEEKRGRRRRTFPPPLLIFGASSPSPSPTFFPPAPLLGWDALEEKTLSAAAAEACRGKGKRGGFASPVTSLY